MNRDRSVFGKCAYETCNHWFFDVGWDRVTVHYLEKHVIDIEVNKILNGFKIESEELDEAQVEEIEAYLRSKK